MRGIIDPVQSISNFPAGSGGADLLLTIYWLIIRCYKYYAESGNNYGHWVYSG